VLVVVAVIVEVVVAGVVVEVIIAGYLDWRSEAFLGSFSVYRSILEDLFNPKYRSTASSVQSEILNNSSVSASTFIIAEP
jgi:hypothetical protein